MSDVDIKVLMVSYVEDNNSQGKKWIFGSGSTVHVCSRKEMFNSLVAKEEGTFKMVDGSAYEIIDTETINITYRDLTVHVLKAVRYVPEARYHLISIGVLDEEECHIQVQQGNITVSQGDRVILREKCEGIYKLTEEDSVRGRVSEISLEGSSS